MDTSTIPAPEPGTPTRTEHDTMGEVTVPAWARWGAQTQRAVDNFAISGRPVDRRLIRSLALVKAAAATVNGASTLVALDAQQARAIEVAAERVASGEFDAHFPVDVFQTGSGTSSNMNANEVIASLANELLGDVGARVHPNDHVNASQSSNDVFPTAIQVAAVEAVSLDLLPALGVLSATLRAKASDLSAVVKAGRTHLMDAVPVTLGQEFGGHATQIEQAADRLAGVLPRLSALPIGGTAVGTGLNAPVGFGAAVAQALSDRSGHAFTEARDHFAAQAAPDALVELSGQLRGLAVALVKVANDLRWMASGPRTGLAEIALPDLQPGSSIMPGKVNPVLCEAVTQVAAQVIGNDAAVAFAGSQGNFELNTYLPVMARNVLESVDLLAAVSALFARRCVAGITADENRCQAFAESSPAVVTSLNPYLGYERSAALIKESRERGVGVRDLVAATGELTAIQLGEALDVMALTRGGLPSE